MSAADSKRAAEIFEKACDLSPEKRCAFLNIACAGDDALRAEVDSLLSFDDRDTAFLDAPPVELDSAAVRAIGETPEAPLPERIGPYRILQLLGEGGMGVVYLADQTEPVKRRVALKVIKRGLDTDQVIARFEAERQALALMDHGNIARVLDAGATEDGRPYFVMEYVAGLPITQYCDRARLDMRARLELFTIVCDAVQHAHQKGLIHRDIKPSNVMVTDIDSKPVVKVIDFGIAKAMQQPLTEKTLFTEHGQLVGTPEYMAPEQADSRGLNVDTRADIYSLGVLLYEMLVGSLPFDPKSLRSAGFAEIQRIIREEEPPKPSTKLSRLSADDSTTAALTRRTDSAGLSRELKGDLDWITMKALEKDRARRYSAASELAEDVRRHLRHEPVLAGPPGAGYRVKKFIRRNRALVGAAAAVTIVLIGGIIGTTSQSIIATRQRIRAEGAEQVANQRAEEAIAARQAEAEQRAEADRQRDEAETQRAEAEREARLAAAVRDFLRNDVIGAADPRNTDDPDTTVREALDRAAASIGERFEDEPGVKAMICWTIGDTYRSLARFDEAETFMRRAVELSEAGFGEEHRNTLGAIDALAGVLSDQAKFDEAEAFYVRAFEIKQRALGPDDPATIMTMNNLGGFFRKRSKFAEAEPLLVTSVEWMREHWGDDHANTGVAMLALGDLYDALGRGDEAELWTQRAFDGLTAALGPDHLYTLSSQTRLAHWQRKRGEYEAAERTFLDLLDTNRRVRGPDHPDTLGVMGNLAMTYRDMGESARASEVYEEQMALYEQSLGFDHPRAIRARNNYALHLTGIGRLDEAEQMTRDVVARATAALGAVHADTAHYRHCLAAVLSRQERLEEALGEYRAVLAVNRELYGPDHARTLRVMSLVGSRLDDLGRHDEAIATFEEMLEICRAASTPNEAFIARLEATIERLKREASADASPGATN